MFDLKPLSKNGIEQALEKALRYRLLNEPWQAESICRDILLCDPENLDAIQTLLLALTDQFDRSAQGRVKEASELLTRLKNEYLQAYYAGVIAERQGTAALKRGSPGSGFIAYDWIRTAMEHYEKADELHPEGREVAILRWNTCARLIMDNNLQAREDEREINMLE